MDRVQRCSSSACTERKEMCARRSKLRVGGRRWRVAEYQLVHRPIPRLERESANHAPYPNRGIWPGLEPGTIGACGAAAPIRFHFPLQKRRLEKRRTDAPSQPRRGGNRQGAYRPNTVGVDVAGAADDSARQRTKACGRAERLGFAGASAAKPIRPPNIAATGLFRPVTSDQRGTEAAEILLRDMRTQFTPRPTGAGATDALAAAFGAGAGR